MGTPHALRFLISKQTTWGECETYFSFPSQSGVTLLGDTGALQRRWAGDFTSGREYFFFFFYEVCLSLVLIKAARWLPFYGWTGEDCIIFMEEARSAPFCHESRRFPLMPCSNDKDVLVQSEIWNDFLFFAPVHVHNKSQWRWLHMHYLNRAEDSSMITTAYNNMCWNDEHMFFVYSAFKGPVL